MRSIFMMAKTRLPPSPPPPPLGANVSRGAVEVTAWVTRSQSNNKSFKPETLFSTCLCVRASLFFSNSCSFSLSLFYIPYPPPLSLAVSLVFFFCILYSLSNIRTLPAILDLQCRRLLLFRRLSSVYSWSFPLPAARAFPCWLGEVAPAVSHRRISSVAFSLFSCSFSR